MSVNTKLWQKPTRLLHLRIDEIADADPDRVWAIFPKVNGEFDKWRNVTFAELARAIDRMAWFINDKLGKSRNFETFAYIGLSDVRYQIMTMAAAKTSYAVLMSSHSNALSSHLNLLGVRNVESIMTSEDTDVSDILAARPMAHFQIPTLDALLSAGHVERYAYTKKPIDAVCDPMAILHTSGSTGAPKPVAYTHGAAAALDKILSLRNDEAQPDDGVREDRVAEYAGRLLLPFAPFHIIGIGAVLGFTVWGTGVYVLPRTDRLPSPADVLATLEAGVADRLLAPPQHLEALAKSDAALAALAKLKSVRYAGGALGTAAGDRISAKVHLASALGSTETGFPIAMDTASADWSYTGLEPTLQGLEWRPHEVDGPDGAPTFELVHARRPATEEFQQIFMNRPDLSTFPTGDLWTPHPTVPHLWRFAGRTDDLVALANGLKLRPLKTEGLVSAHALVRGALVCGAGHLQPVLLVELAEPAYALPRAQVEAEVWAEVAKANAAAPPIGRVARTHVVFVPAGREFLRTAKGSVRRRVTEQAFADVTEKAWAEHGDEQTDLLAERTAGAH